MLKLKRFLPGIPILAMVFISAISVAAQESDTLIFTVNVTSMTQGGTKKTDSIVVRASDPREAERQAEAQFKANNRRSTFIRAEAEFVQAQAPDRTSKSIFTDVLPPSPKPDSPLKFTVKVTYMTQGGTKKTDSISILASDPREAEREAEAQFKANNRRSTFIRANAE